MNLINGTEENQPAKFKLWHRSRDIRVLKVLLIVVIFLASVIIIKDEMVWQLGLDEAGNGGYENEDSSEDSCNISGIELHGDLLTYISPEDIDSDGNYTADQTASENIVSQIMAAEENDKIKGILLEIDSYGGWPVAGEEISQALLRATKPTIAFIRGAGVSAAYLAATGADRIFATQNSDVGSIGVTMSYLDNSRQNQIEGLTYNQLSSGKFKDARSSDRPLSEEEKKLFMRDINIVHQNFVTAVAANRKLDIKKVEALADGSTMLGEMALENGLIDQVGGWFEVRDYLKEKIGEETEICW